MQLNNLRQTLPLFGLIKLAALMIVVATPIAAQSAIQVAPFQSIELHDGTHATVSYGATQTVTMVKGSLDCAQFTVTRARLVIEKHQRGCSRKYDFEVHIVTPNISEVMIANGGRLQVKDSFPRQPEIKAVVIQGGSIDLRTVVVDRVTASIEEGGRILVRPHIVLTASIESGGQIIYWDDPSVKPSIKNGGIIAKGSPADLNKPISELNESVIGQQPHNTSKRPRGQIF